MSSSKLSVGIVGLPNVGKSTLFNALLKRQVALAANYPFATVDPNTGIVEVPDKRLEKLRNVVESNEGVVPPLKPAVIEFVDIAGLVAGASKGEGLGNKFLANIRECDLICHVLRAFEDGDVVLTGKMNPTEDLETIRTELILKDMETVERVRSTKYKVQSIKEKELRDRVMERLATCLGSGKMANSLVFDDDELEIIRDLHLLTLKPEIFVVNVSEEQLKNQRNEIRVKLVDELKSENVVVISAKIEGEIASLDDEDQSLFMEELGIEESGVERMARAAYVKLGLISFLTAGKIECRAWTVRSGALAPEAAGVIHSDFSKKFIKAQVIGWEDFVQLGGWKKAREVGKVRMEGKEYVMRDGDVVEFMIGA